MKRRGFLSPDGELFPIHREGQGVDIRRLSLIILRRGILSPSGGGQGEEKKHVLLFILLFISSISLFAQPDRKFIRKGNGNYNDGSYKQAEVDYRKALENNPSSKKADYNLGNSLYKQGNFEAAAGRYNSLIQQSHTERSRSATTPSGHTERSRSATSNDLSRYYYNLGNALFQSQKYRESIEAYKMSLRNNPSDLDTKHNLQLAQKLMHEAEQQQQSGNNQQNKDKEQQQQQQKDKEQQNKDQQQNQDKSQQNRDQQENNEQQQNQPQDQQDYKGINPQDAERILDALENQEKQTLRDVQDKKENRQMEVEKNW